MRRERVTIGRIEVDKITRKDVFKKIQHWVEQKKSALIVTPYSEIVVYAETMPHYAQAINEADLVLPDGIGVLWADMYMREPISLARSYIRILNRHVGLYQTFPEQIRGSEMLEKVLELADRQKLRVYFLGGSPESLQLLGQKLISSYSNVVVGGMFQEKITSTIEQKQVFQEIADSYVDLVVISLSPPLQEQWGRELYEVLKAQDRPGVIFCFGGSIDVLVGKKEAPPQLVRAVGLEWLWRFMIQPSRLRRMYRAVVEFPFIIHKYKRSQSL